ncbi:hypothetical protein Ddye_014346 [Dipteronia dyeriana]|uniref:Acid phosphatase/vanadium-dependent haloperoxidase-related protein n=1 Tax=Dipteronia dyeriana TaxID=168575 RepID=A0AAE0CKF9_9ROSI|nr:hypothetical protein Ddye_014346 [Dipteronia dyeriana]
MDMVLQCSTSSPYSCALSSHKATLAFSNRKNKLNRFRHLKRAPSCCLIKVGAEDIAEIVHNKVLIAAGVSAAIGQLSKPFTGYLLYGRHFDLKATIQPGGFPSTHSSSVVAAATCLALERGFSDSIFGLTVVYACLVMYDAQGVRREVGIHARTLNRVLVPKSKDGEQGTNIPPLVLKSYETTKKSGLADDDDNEETSIVLKESIGHTEVEVVAGALLGFFVSLAVYAIF